MILKCREKEKLIKNPLYKSKKIQFEDKNYLMLFQRHLINYVDTH